MNEAPSQSVEPAGGSRLAQTVIVSHWRPASRGSRGVIHMPRRKYSIDLEEIRAIDKEPAHTYWHVLDHIAFMKWPTREAQLRLVEWSGGAPSLDQRLPSYLLFRASWQMAARSC
jgi:hypothetical protein